MAKKLSELKSRDQVVVKLFAVQEVREGETITLKPEQNIVITKASYEQFEQNDKGFAPALNRKIELLGTPKFKKVDSEYGGKVDVLDGYEEFTKEKEAEPAA